MIGAPGRKDSHVAAQGPLGIRRHGAARLVLVDLEAADQVGGDGAGDDEIAVCHIRPPVNYQC